MRAYVYNDRCESMKLNFLAPDNGASRGANIRSNLAPPLYNEIHCCTALTCAMAFSLGIAIVVISSDIQ